MMSQDAFSGDDDLYINLLQNIRMMMECPPSLGEKVSLGIYSGLRASKKWGEMGKWGNKVNEGDCVYHIWSDFVRKES